MWCSCRTPESFARVAGDECSRVARPWSASRCCSQYGRLSASTKGVVVSSPGFQHTPAPAKISRPDHRNQESVPPAGNHCEGLRRVLPGQGCLCHVEQCTLTWQKKHRTSCDRWPQRNPRLTSTYLGPRSDESCGRRSAEGGIRRESIFQTLDLKVGGSNQRATFEKTVVMGATAGLPNSALHERFYDGIKPGKSFPVRRAG
jgi:hypothetical protein